MSIRLGNLLKHRLTRMSSARERQRRSEEPVALLTRTHSVEHSVSIGPTTAGAGGLIKTLSWHHLVGVTFFAVCGGDYGLEDSVGAGGVGLTLIGLCILPWVWSLPIALMTAELSSMIPEAGGYVVWAHRAFGPFWATQNAVWNLWFPIFRIAGGLRWLASVLMLIIVTMLNLIGVDVVAQVSNLFALFVISPFIGLTLAGLAIHGVDPHAWTQGLGWDNFHGDVANDAVNSSNGGAMETSAVTTSPHSTKHEDAGMVIGVGIHGAGIGPEDSPIRWGTFLSVLLWNTSGYDSVGALAAEVHDPGRDFPRAMYATITLITLVYLVPLLVATSLDSEHVHEWTDGSFVRVASEHIGDWLAAWVTIGGALSCFGLLNTLLCTSARVAVSAAKLRVLPAAIANVHEASGTPRNATLLLASVLALACALPFSQLVSISMLFYGATTLVELLALLALRIKEPSTPRPFRIALSGSLLVLFLLLPILLCLTLIALAPREAWVLFFVSSLAAMLAHARSSGFFASRSASTGWLRGCLRACLCTGAWSAKSASTGFSDLTSDAREEDVDAPHMNTVAYAHRTRGCASTIDHSGSRGNRSGGRDEGMSAVKYSLPMAAVARVNGIHREAELAELELEAMGDADDDEDDCESHHGHVTDSRALGGAETAHFLRGKRGMDDGASSNRNAMGGKIVGFRAGDRFDGLGRRNDTVNVCGAGKIAELGEFDPHRSSKAVENPRMQ